DTGFVTDAADIALSGVEVWIGARNWQDRVVASVVVAHAFAIGTITGGGAELVDPRVLVGRYALRGDLAADPVRLLGEDHASAQLRRGECRRDPTKSAADDENI